MKRENPEDQDSAWQRIVDNYGDRAELEATDDVPDAPDQPASQAPDVDESVDEAVPVLLDEEDGFVPERPPPVPMPPPDRFLAWLGVFGSPTALLVFLVLGIGIPTVVSWVLIGGFVFGFCYLVFTLPRSPRDPWDDGAVV